MKDVACVENNNDIESSPLESPSWPRAVCSGSLTHVGLFFRAFILKAPEQNSLFVLTKRCRPSVPTAG